MIGHSLLGLSTIFLIRSISPLVEGDVVLCGANAGAASPAPIAAADVTTRAGATVAAERVGPGMAAAEPPPPISWPQLPQKRVLAGTGCLHFGQFIRGSRVWLAVAVRTGIGAEPRHRRVTCGPVGVETW